MNPRLEAGGPNPANRGHCDVHGRHDHGLICTACATLPPRWADTPPPRDPAPRVYARVLGDGPGAVECGGAG